ncbi:MAG: recombinase RecT [Bacteroidales bacterium]|nr:recombinase RecT [Bacteroidales bacterium]
MTQKNDKQQTAGKQPEKNPHIIEQVQARVTELEKLNQLNLPQDYSPGNALRAAYLTLLQTYDKNKSPVLETCTKSSIANSLMRMIVLGLNPMKQQCAFIAYGNKLVCQEEYPGRMALAKRYANVSDVHANLIYEDDDVEIEFVSGKRFVVNHEQRFENIADDKIIGAYAVVNFQESDTIKHEIMTMEQIHKSWKMGPTKGNSDAHKNFPGEMAKRTVINRALKTLINSSSDSVILGKQDGEPGLNFPADNIGEQGMIETNVHEVDEETGKISDDNTTRPIKEKVDEMAQEMEDAAEENPGNESDSGKSKDSKETNKKAPDTAKNNKNGNQQKAPF